MLCNNASSYPSLPPQEQYCFHQDAQDWRDNTVYTTGAIRSETSIEGTFGRYLNALAFEDNTSWNHLKSLIKPVSEDSLLGVSDESYTRGSGMHLLKWGGCDALRVLVSGTVVIEAPEIQEKSFLGHFKLTHYHAIAP